MSTQEIVNYLFIIAGIVLTLVSAYRIYKKGIVIWLVLIVVGVSGIHYGLNYRAPTSVDDLMNGFDVSELSGYSKDKLLDACRQLSE